MTRFWPEYMPWSSTISKLKQAETEICFRPARIFTLSPMPKNATKLRRVSIREDYYSGIKPASVDQAAGIIKRVKILGLESDNGRRYTLAALKKAIPLYEG